MNSELNLFAEAVASAEHHDADILNMHEQFQRYLDRTGTTSKLVDALVKVLDATQARPTTTLLEDPRTYFLSILGQCVKPKTELKSLKTEIIKMKQSLDRIRAKNTNLRSLLDIPEPTESAAEEDELKKLLDDDDEHEVFIQPDTDSEEMLHTYEALRGQEGKATAWAQRKLEPKPGEILGEDEDQGKGAPSKRASAACGEESGEVEDEDEESLEFDPGIDTTDFLEDSEEGLSLDSDGKESSGTECSTDDSELDAACLALQALQGMSASASVHEDHAHSHGHGHYQK